MHRAIPHRLSALTRGAIALLAVAAAPSFASSSGVVISQVYGGNGNTFASDYVELFNAGSSAVAISGWSIQYGSATGTGTFSSNGVTALNGTLQPGQYWLVKLASAATGAPLPPPDATGTTNISSVAGKLVLASTSTGPGLQRRLDALLARAARADRRSRRLRQRQLLRRHAGADARRHHRAPARHPRLHRHQQQRHRLRQRRPGTAQLGHAARLVCDGGGATPPPPPPPAPPTAAIYQIQGSGSKSPIRARS